MKTLLIPCYFFGGHHLEYLLHFFEYALQDTEKAHNYVFALSEDFKNDFAKLPQAEHILIDYLPLEQTAAVRKGNRYTTSYHNNRLTNLLVRKHSATDVLYLAFSYNFIFQSIMTISGVNYHGIMFVVYPYDWEGMSMRIKLQSVLTHWGAARNHNIKNVFIGNDLAGANYLNRLYSTDKFRYIPDPYVPIKAEGREFALPKEEAKLLNGKKVLFHFGSFRPTKGSIELLQAILITPSETTNQLCFVLAGKIPADMKQEMSILIEQARQKTTIILHDEFCSYEYIAAVCLHSDYILMPYRHNSSSSGMYGYASQFGVPVVASNRKMTRKIVTRYRLGVLLNDISAKGLSEFYQTVPTRNKVIVGKEYTDTHSVAEFNAAIFKEIFI